MSNATKKCGANLTLIHCRWQYKKVRPLWKAVRNKLNVTIPHSSVISLLGIVPKWNKNLKCSPKNCIRTFKDILFVITKNWNNWNVLELQHGWKPKQTCGTSIEMESDSAKKGQATDKQQNGGVCNALC